MKIFKEFLRGKQKCVDDRETGVNFGILEKDQMK